MSLLDRLENTKLESKDHPDIEFLKHAEVGGIINRGLAELYRIQPKNPITFFANWLLNESRSSEIKKKIEESNNVKEELKIKYKEREKLTKEEEARIEEELKKEQRKKDDFIKSVIETENIDQALDSFCEKLKQLVNATGVYIGVFDKKRKLPIGEDEEENAHLLDENVIRYINWSNDHSFLKNKFLETDRGVTYELFIPKEEIKDDNPDAGVVNNDPNSTQNKLEPSQVNPKEIIPKHILIDEVVRNPKIRFFREPRLGCYFCIDCTYNASLFPLALYSAIANLEEFQINQKIQEEKKAAYEARLIELEKDREKTGSHDVSHHDGGGLNNNNDLPDGDNPDGFEDIKVELKDPITEEKKIIICLDTLGQDRIFNEEEKKYIFDFTLTLKSSWEALEKKLLLKDRNIKIELDAIDKILKDQNPQEKIENDEEKHLKEYFASEKFIENPITDEKLKHIESDYQRSRYIINSFFEDPQINKAFLMFRELEFIEFERMFQNVLYFIGISNKEINEENTNKLDWKKSRNFWGVDILEQLKIYHPFGPKIENLSSFAMGQRLAYYFQTINTTREDLKGYSFVLSRLLDFLILILKIRRDDIVRRRGVVDNFMEERIKMIGLKEEQENARTRDLEIARGNTDTNDNGDPIEFNEEEFLRQWDEGKPVYDILEEIPYDIDNDWDFDKEK